jgi:ribosomal protein L19E
MVKVKVEKPVYHLLKGVSLQLGTTVENLVQGFTKDGLSQHITILDTNSEPKRGRPRKKSRRARGKSKRGRPKGSKNKRGRPKGSKNKKRRVSRKTKAIKAVRRSLKPLEEEKTPAKRRMPKWGEEE